MASFVKHPMNESNYSTTTPSFCSTLEITWIIVVVRKREGSGKLLLLRVSRVILRELSPGGTMPD